ncbi:MAG: xanthine dehydrogenase family protein molybdopterin-binding subunit, partial [Acidimicrobiales bacterium]
MSMIGTRVTRIEDPDLLTVGGMYVDDLAPADALHVTFVRSMMPHAKLTEVDVAEAESHPDVVGVFTARSLGVEPMSPGFGMLNQEMKRSCLANDIVRYVGEPIAAVVSRTRHGGVDAAEAIIIDYDELPLVLNPEDALAADATAVFPEAGTNVVFQITAQKDEVEFMADAEITVELEFCNHRMAPAPLEPRATIARWESIDGVDHLTQWSSTQGAHGTRDGLARACGIDPSQVRVICPDVGGAFGAKSGNYPEDQVCALIARRLGRPVRWAETRSESMVGLAHGRATSFRCVIGGSSDGTITHYSLNVIQDSGAHAAIGALLPHFTNIMTSGPYDIANVRFDSKSVITNTVPVGAYRGAGRPEATHALERMIDVFAARLGLDPAELRRRNLIKPDAFPLTTPTGASMDSGEYERALDAALDAVAYKSLRAEQTARRADPNPTAHLGIGISTYVEITNPMGNGEYGSVEVKPDGTALVLTGSSSHGQGHHTAFAQLASDRTGIPIDKITVRHGDTAEVPRGGGTGGSKSLQLGGSAVAEASDLVTDTAKAAAAELLEANPTDIVLNKDAGAFHVVGTPALSVDWGRIANSLAEQDRRLFSEIDFTPSGATFPFGTHVCVVEVDAETGSVEIRRFVACDDAGTIINPLLVDGQVHGGVAAGIAHAMWEEFAYDDYGNP